MFFFSGFTLSSQVGPDMFETRSDVMLFLTAIDHYVIHDVQEPARYTFIGSSSFQFSNVCHETDLNKHFALFCFVF